MTLTGSGRSSCHVHTTPNDDDAATPVIADVTPDNTPLATPTARRLASRGLRRVVITPRMLVV